VADASLKEIVAGISADVAKHANGAPQSDDITMLVLRVTHLN
jgi:serine phosphatase RsbU (regulator of sigma subunit)